MSFCFYINLLLTASAILASSINKEMDEKLLYKKVTCALSVSPITWLEVAFNVRRLNGLFLSDSACDPLNWSYNRFQLPTDGLFQQDCHRFTNVFWDDEKMNSIILSATAHQGLQWQANEAIAQLSPLYAVLWSTVFFSNSLFETQVKSNKLKPSSNKLFQTWCCYR